MKAFRNRAGENNVLDEQMSLPEVEDKSEEVEIPFDFNDANEFSNENSEFNVEFRGDVEHNVVKESYRQKYVKKMVDDADVHYQKFNFNPGDFVIIQKSFDNNPRTRKNKMDQCYEEGIWINIERIGSDSFKVKKNKEMKEFLKLFQRIRLRSASMILKMNKLLKYFFNNFILIS